MIATIASSYADVEVLLQRLSGEHRSSRGDRIAALLLALFLAVTLSWVGIRLMGEKPELAAWIMAGVMIVLGPGLAVASLADAYATYRVSPAGMEKVVPLRGVAWRVAASEIHHVELVFAKSWQLKIVTAADVARRVPLFPSLRAAFATLYPAFGAEPAQLPRKLGYVLYALLGVVVVGVAVLLWALASRGLLEW